MIWFSTINCHDHEWVYDHDKNIMSFIERLYKVYDTLSQLSHSCNIKVRLLIKILGKLEKQMILHQNIPFLTCRQSNSKESDLKILNIYIKKRDKEKSKRSVTYIAS